MTTITGQPVGVIVEGPTDDRGSHRVESRPAAGGRSLSSIDADGGFSADLSGPLRRGRSAEGRTLKTLIQALRAGGSTVDRLAKNRDAHGEDAVLVINGVRVVVQVVSVPVDAFLWKGLAATEAASSSGTLDDAVQMIRDALVHKRGKAVDTLLVLDAAQIGAIVRPALVAAYVGAFVDAETEFKVREVWIVGPTVRSTIRLKS